MKIKSFDYVIIIATALILIVLSVHVYSQPLKASLVRVMAGERSWVYALDEERRVQPLGEPGTCVIEITDGSARVVESDCPEQICMTMGAISQSGQWIACLPHGVFIDLEGADVAESTVDGVAW